MLNQSARIIGFLKETREPVLHVSFTFFYLNGYEVDENHDEELADII